MLEHKNANEVLYDINDFIAKNGKPKIFQSDNGQKFSNKNLKDYCFKNDIKLIYSSPRHPNTKGFV